MIELEFLYAPNQVIKLLIRLQKQSQIEKFSNKTMGQ
jgi:hypothetical protein